VWVSLPLCLAARAVLRHAVLTKACLAVLSAGTSSQTPPVNPCPFGFIFRSLLQAPPTSKSCALQTAPPSERAVWKFG